MNMLLFAQAATAAHINSTCCESGSHTTIPNEINNKQKICQHLTGVVHKHCLCQYTVSGWGGCFHFILDNKEKSH